jgi:hypothetical protein
MAGNRIGSRSKYVYTSDSGKLYVLETDASLAIAGFGAASAAPVLFNPAVPGTATPAPKRFRPRVVYVQASDGARKALVAFSPTSDAYKSEVAATYEIDTEAGWASTGRRGEQISF